MLLRRSLAILPIVQALLPFALLAIVLVVPLSVPTVGFSKDLEDEVEIDRLVGLISETIAGAGDSDAVAAELGDLLDDIYLEAVEDGAPGPVTYQLLAATCALGLR